MQAIVKTLPRRGVNVEEADIPKIKPNEVLIRVKAAGICGTDVHVYLWSRGYELKRLPIILGHEFSGEVVEVGKSVKVDIAEGDRVVAEPGTGCGTCFFCKSGKENLCFRRRTVRLGLEKDGAFSEYVAVPAESIHKMPPDISFEEAALVEPASVAFHAVTLGHIAPGEVATVIGPGPIGLLITQALKICGTSAVLMVARSRKRGKSRLEIAKKLGAEKIIIEEEEDPVKTVRESTPTSGADVVFEASGNPIAIEQSIKMVRPGGRVVLIGIYPQSKEINCTAISAYEKEVKGSYGAPGYVWDKVLSLMANRRLAVKPLITHMFSLQEAEKAFEACIRREAVKALFIMRT